MSGQEFNILGPRSGVIRTIDPVWTTLRQQAEREASEEPALAGVIHATVLAKPSASGMRALQPRFARRLTSSCFFGVPSGWLVSQWMVPL